MILVDSSVWIDDFRGSATPQTDKLDSLLGNQPSAVGDLILTEVLQGFRRDQDVNKTEKLLSPWLLLNSAAKTLRFKPPRTTGPCAPWASPCVKPSTP